MYIQVIICIQRIQGTPNAATISALMCVIERYCEVLHPTHVEKEIAQR